MHSFSHVSYIIYSFVLITIINQIGTTTRKSKVLFKILDEDNQMHSSNPTYVLEEEGLKAQNQRQDKPNFSKFYNNEECTLTYIPNYDFDVLINKYAEDIPYGQCTEWADGRYYQITGHHTNFNGNAHLWANLARKKLVKNIVKHNFDKHIYMYNYEWIVSDKPPTHEPSIIVVPKGVLGAEKYGHVAVVESVSSDGKYVCTSNWNFPDLGKLTLLWINIENQPVEFIYHI